MKERRPAVGNGRSGAAFDWAGLAPAARAKAIAGLRAAGLGDAAIARQFGVGREDLAAALSHWDALSPAGKAEAVRRLRGEGLSATAIAARLGSTKGAVIGVMHRNGMSVPGTTTHVMRRPKQDGSAAGGRTRSAQVHAGPVSLAPAGQSAVGSGQSEDCVERVRRAPPKTALPDAVVVADPPPAGGIPFAALDAQFLRCRSPLWTDHTVPLDEKRWCGAAVEPGRSYCPGCAGRLVQRVPGWLKRITGEAAPVAPTPASLARTEAQRRGRAAARRASSDCPLPTADCRSSAPRRQR